MRDERTTPYFAARLRAKDSIKPSGLCYAIDIERDFPLEEWVYEIAKVPDELHDEAAAYLRDRYRVRMQWRKDAPLREKLERLRKAGFKV